MKTLPQLTVAILDEYVQFKGDMLAYVSSGRGTLNFDWDRIDALLQNIFLVRAGLASDAFRSQVESELRTIASDESLRQRLWDMAADRVVAAHGRIVI
jgi:hypothetical protein